MLKIRIRRYILFVCCLGCLLIPSHAQKLFSVNIGILGNFEIENIVSELSASEALLQSDMTVNALLFDQEDDLNQAIENHEIVLCVIQGRPFSENLISNDHFRILLDYIKGQDEIMIVSSNIVMEKEIDHMLGVCTALDEVCKTDDYHLLNEKEWLNRYSENGYPVEWQEIHIVIDFQLEMKKKK